MTPQHCTGVTPQHCTGVTSQHCTGMTSQQCTVMTSLHCTAGMTSLNFIGMPLLHCTTLHWHGVTIHPPCQVPFRIPAVASISSAYHNAAARSSPSSNITGAALELLGGDQGMFTGARATMDQITHTTRPLILRTTIRVSNEHSIEANLAYAACLTPGVRSGAFNKGPHNQWHAPNEMLARKGTEKGKKKQRKREERKEEKK